MVFRDDYKSLEEVSQKGDTPLEITPQKPVLEGGIGEVVTLATVDRDAWSWVTHQEHQLAGWTRQPEAYRFFYLWNCELEGV